MYCFGNRLIRNNDIDQTITLNVIIIWVDFWLFKCVWIVVVTKGKYFNRPQIQQAKHTLKMEDIK